MFVEKLTKLNRQLSTILGSYEVEAIYPRLIGRGPVGREDLKERTVSFHSSRKHLRRMKKKNSWLKRHDKVTYIGISSVLLLGASFDVVDRSSRYGLRSCHLHRNCDWYVLIFMSSCRCAVMILINEILTYIVIGRNFAEETVGGCCAVPWVPSNLGWDRARYTLPE